MPLHKTLSTAWQTLQEELVSTTPPVTPPRLSAVSPEAMLASDPLAMTATVHAELTGLSTQHRQLQVHMATLVQSLETTLHQPTLTGVLRLLSEMETTVETIQTAHAQLEHTLCEQRLFLSFQEQTLAKAAAEKAIVLHTLDAIIQDRARESHALQRLEGHFASLEADLARSRTEYSTLSRKHESLVGQYHTRLLDSQKVARTLSSTGHEMPEFADAAREASGVPHDSSPAQQ